jgi:hypothetical protein
MLETRLKFAYFVLVIASGSVLPLHAATSEAPPSWLPGIWQMTQDEDKGPLGELVEFTVSGEYFFYGKECLAMKPIRFHVHNGDIYVTNIIEGKGPVSVIFHPIEKHSKLTFTSPRTFNNATYSKTSLTRCKKQS